MSCWQNICKIRYRSLARGATPCPSTVPYSSGKGCLGFLLSAPSVSLTKAQQGAACPQPLSSPRTCPGWATPLAPALHALHLFQGIVWPQVFSGIVGNCINGLANYILVSMLRLGVRGSAYATTISYFVQTIFLFLYIVLKKLHLETWAGWSSQCLQDWGPFFSLAVPSMLMVCIEWWAYEIGSFVMGLISVLDLSGQAILYELATVVYMIPLGLSNAVCVRVGTALGAADTAQAKRSAISGMLCTVGTSLVVGTLLSLLRNKLGHIFTNDEEVIALVNKVLPIYIVFQLFEAVCCVYGGVLRGTGKQAFGAIVNAVMYYVVGLPLGIILTFVVRMRIMGLWLGMLACGLLAAAAFAVYTARMDWKLAAEEAQKHAGLLPQSPDGTVTTVTAVTAAPRPGPAKAVTSSGNAGLDTSAGHTPCWGDIAPGGLVSGPGANGNLTAQAAIPPLSTDAWS
uniref:Multidrug and toxin extrusion protein n=1 Tax=Ursus americanus TaxID=9643 RepID=A0A452R654_URSAM